VQTLTREIVVTAETGTHVLLVDDEEQFLAALADRLQLRGIQAETVTSGEDALRVVEGQSFDAVVLDLAMPRVDGIETLRLLKEKQPELQIIMLTGHGSVQHGIAAMKTGAVDFLEKPIDLKILLDKIGEARKKRLLIVEKKHREEIKAIIARKSG
jgi:DNA-binding NtrC family response regulator